jgi:hypothetical protein
MDSIKQRIKIAELCGVEHGLVCHSHSVVPYDRVLSHEFNGVKVKKCPWCRADLWQMCPDYLKDLNACRQMEKFLTNVERRQYETMLTFKCAKGDPYPPPSNCMAEAWQRAECFLRVKNSWEEEKPCTT